MKFKTPYNAIPSKGEVNNEPSQTVPDQTMSVREILERHARGLPITGGKTPIYNGEENDFPDLDRLDISERHELREAARAETARIRKQLAKQEKQNNKPAPNDSPAAPPSGA